MGQNEGISRSPLLIGTTTERDMARRMAQARMTIGGSALLAAGLARVALGLRADHDNPSSRALGRLFGVRNVVLGAWALSVRDADLDSRRLCYALNAAVDAGDVAVLLWPVVRRQGITRFALSSAVLGSMATVAWIDMLDAAAETPAGSAPV